MLQARPRTIGPAGRWKGTLLLLASSMAVCKLSRELDFCSPNVGPRDVKGAEMMGEIKKRGTIHKKCDGVMIIQQGQSYW